MLLSESTLSFCVLRCWKGFPMMAGLIVFKWVLSPCSTLWGAPMTSGALRSLGCIGGLITRSRIGNFGPIMVKRAPSLLQISSMTDKLASVPSPVWVPVIPFISSGGSPYTYISELVLDALPFMLLVIPSN